ncbi:hypothetical protein GGS26DRAFT_601920 [Hypomontagnella submonticulosa]|nr:hypothetical protein GGS26DRAFT_601920 [Hypomontagnella submonticulosa]
MLTDSGLPSSATPRCTTSVRLAKDQSKPLQTPDSEHRPAVKESLLRYRPKLVAPKITQYYNSTPPTKNPRPTNMKTPVSDQAVNRTKTRKVPTKGTSDTISRIHQKAPNKGRRDPYEFISDSDTDDTPGPGYSSPPTKRGITTPAEKARGNSEASLKGRESVLLSTPIRTSTKSPMCIVASKGAKQKNSGETGRTRPASEVLHRSEAPDDKWKIVKFENKGKSKRVSHFSEDEYEPSSSNDEQPTEKSSDDKIISHLSQDGSRSHDLENIQISPADSGRGLHNSSSSVSSRPTRSPSSGEEVDSTMDLPQNCQLVRRDSTSVRATSSDSSGLSETGDEATEDASEVGFRAEEDPTDSLAYYEDLTKKRRIIDYGDGKSKDGTQPAKFAERKWWWYLNGWLHRYQHLYDYDYKTGNMSIDSGPYRGWIIDGPGKRSHLPDYREPDDQTLAEADKTAERKWWHWEIYSSESEQGYESDQQSESEYGQGDEQSSTAKSEAKTTGGTECAKRTAEYVLTSNLGDDMNSQQEVESSSSTSCGAQGRLQAKPAPYDHSKLRSTSSETTSSSSSSKPTSTLIARQPATDQTTPSHQALSLTKTRETPSKAKHASATNLDKATKRDAARLLTDISPSVIRPNQHARSTSQDSSCIPKASKIPARTSIVVELPGLTKDERAEYEAVSPSQEDGSFIQPPKSFKEINESTPSPRGELDSSDEETLRYIIYQSPKLLNTITKVDERSDSVFEGKGGKEMPEQAVAEQLQWFGHSPGTRTRSNDEVGEQSSLTTGSEHKRKFSSTDLATADGAKDSSRKRKRNRPNIQNRRRRQKQQAGLFLDKRHEADAKVSLMNPSAADGTKDSSRKRKKNASDLKDRRQMRDQYLSATIQPSASEYVVFH